MLTTYSYITEALAVVAEFIAVQKYASQYPNIKFSHTFKSI